jgi:hypothetical protein
VGVFGCLSTVVCIHPFLESVPLPPEIVRVINTPMCLAPIHSLTTHRSLPFRLPHAAAAEAMPVRQALQRCSGDPRCPCASSSAAHSPPLGSPSRSRSGMWGPMGFTLIQHAESAKTRHSTA